MTTKYWVYIWPWKYFCIWQLWKQSRYSTMAALQLPVLWRSFRNFPDFSRFLADLHNFCGGFLGEKCRRTPTDRAMVKFQVKNGDLWVILLKLWWGRRSNMATVWWNYFGESMFCYESSVQISFFYCWIQ